MIEDEFIDYRNYWNGNDDFEKLLPNVFFLKKTQSCVVNPKARKTRYVNQS